MHVIRWRCAGTVGAAAWALSVYAAEVVLPQGRNVFWTGEAVEVAVAGLARGQTATAEIAPSGSSLARAVSWTVEGDGGTVTRVLAADSLAPGAYSIRLDGQGMVPLTVVSGVPTSRIPLSQTTQKPIDDGGNFFVSNAFCFGLRGADGQPLRDVRGRRSPGMESFERTAASGYPAVCYMYWTGYVTHKPFGTGKSWASPAMQEAMRRLSFSAAQRLRRYAPLWLGVGPIDEPGLSWGHTPAGGMASGFPNWDEQAWYEERGWAFTQDIAGQSDADWLKYLAIRCGIIKESYQQARDDLASVWPAVHFEGDLYALHAVMDGTDGLNQQVNDTPTSHVFFDWSGGPMSVPGQFYLEKCHAPAAKVAHAMNGQLEGVRGPQRPLYHWLMNAMLQGGLASNWWLNTGGMTSEDLRAVNAPVTEWGPLFLEMAPAPHDVAVLWGYTELALRQKAMAGRESVKKSGEQVKLMVPMPTRSEMTEAELQSNAYEVGGTYANQVLGLHQVLRRAGYAAHILHEALVPTGALRSYRVLCVVGQTAAFPPAVSRAIAEFVGRGGVVLLDQSCSIGLAGASTMAADFGADRLRGLGLTDAWLAKRAAGKREASVYATNLHLNEVWRAAVPAVKAALVRTVARPVATTESRDLSVERHRGGDGDLVLVLNGAERHPADTPADGEYPRYNPAAATHTFRIEGIRAGASVWCIEGLDWRKVTRVAAPSVPITGEFAAGEMKLYLVAPAAPRAIALSARLERGRLAVAASLQGRTRFGAFGRSVRMPWPLKVTVAGPGGDVLYVVHRAMDCDGHYAESFPLGRNAPAGGYTVVVESPIENLRARATAPWAEETIAPAAAAGSVCVVDQDPIGQFLVGRPALTIAYANEIQKAVADKLAAALAAKGFEVVVKPEAGLLTAVAYPRVLDPFVTVWSVGGAERPVPGEIKERLTLDEHASDDWRRPGSLTTVGSSGFLDWVGQDRETAYGPGVRLYVDERRQVTVLNATAAEVRTDAAFRARWCRPWTRLTSYVGNYQLPAQLPEAYTCDSHLIALGDSQSSHLATVLQASEILTRVADDRYPGPGKALVQFAWSPFAVGKNVIFIGAVDGDGLLAGAHAVCGLVQ